MQKIKALLDRLPIGATISALAIHAARRLTSSSSTLSYAQNGEDILIAGILGWPRAGLYVDVGCHDPIRLSNTYSLYMRGLSGICIDANDEFAARFKKERPLDTFVCACVGEESGDVEFKIYKDRALSSVSDNQIKGIGRDQYELVRTEIRKIRKVGEILDERNWPHDFELLSIDVEEHDFSALKSVNLSKYRPRLIVIEAHGSDTGYISSHPIAEYCLKFGYRPVAAQKSNLFFLRGE